VKPFFNFFCFLLLLFVSSTSFSQTSITSPGKYFPFKNYTTQNGLINNVVYCLAQDKNGYIWIGSDLGLTRFDGKFFYHKAIPEIYNNSAFVKYIETTENKNIIATSLMQGLLVQQDNGRFKQYFRRGYFELGQNVFNSVKYCPDGRVLINTTNSICLFTEDSIQQLYNSGNDGAIFRTIEVDQKHRIWFGGRFGLGIMQQNGKDYTPVFLHEFNNIYIVKIFFDDEGTLHVGTSQGYYRVKWRQPSNWNSNYTVEQPFHQLKDAYINHIYLDKNRNLWLSTSSYGVFRTKGDNITLHLTQENGLLSSTVECVLQDHEENYWFGTNSGISMIDNFDNYAIAQNGIRLKGALGMICDAEQRIWIYSWSKLFVFQDDKLTPIDFKGTPIEKTGIFQMEIFNSELIISNQSGLYKMELGKAIPNLQKIKKIANFPSTNRYKLRSLVADSTGIWLGTERKLYNYYKSQFLPVTFSYNDTISLRPNKMMRDKYGYFWYCDYTYGLFHGTLSRPAHNKLLFDNITVYQSLKADSAFVTAWISDMAFDKDGNLWFATKYTGVYKLVINAKGVVSYQLYSTANGLLSNDVNSIYCDNDGIMWFMTQKGINTLKKDCTGAEIMDKLNINEGIEGAGIWSLQMGSRLYLLTDEGVYIIQNQLFKEKPKIAPKLLITNLLINGVPYLDFSENESLINLTHGQNNLTIEFSAIAFKNANDIRYQYKLEGRNDEWSTSSERGFVEYASLHPGNYTFKVRALVDNIVGEETTLNFRIARAFYQTVWFYMLIAFTISAILYSFYKYRMNQTIKVERMRTRIASDLHDDIGSTLSSISMLSEMASRNDQKSPLAKSLSIIGENSREVLSSMDDIIWSVNPKNDSLSNLIVRLREYAIPVCEAKNIMLIMNVEETIYAMKLEMEERKSIYLIVKEAINNAVKYSECKNLMVDFINNHYLEISIKDDGCGFDTAALTSRNGLINMERRAKQIGATFSVKSESNVGTYILLKTKNHINI